MPRLRWLVGGLLLLSALAAVVVSRGPLGTHPVLAYEEFLTDFQAGRIGQIVQWRNQLEVTADGQLRIVTVPPGRDLPGDLAAARSAGQVGINYSLVPDAWPIVTTPLVPLALAVACLAILMTELRRPGRDLVMGGDALSP